MDLYYQFDISYFSMLLLTVLLLTIILKKDFFSFTNRLFIGIIVVNIYMLGLEIASWMFDRLPGVENHFMNYMTNMLFAWSTPLITSLWATYIDYHMFKSVERLKKRFFYLHGMFINTLFIGINFFTPFIFSVSENNVYSREPFMWLIILVNFMVVLYMWSVALRNRDKINKGIVFAMLIYILVPAIAAAFQVLLFGPIIIWPIMSMTLIVTYIFLETTSNSYDYLTSLINRQKFDDYIKHLVDMKIPFSLAMIDLDKFKQINDTYGHAAGDEALKCFANASKKVFEKTDIIARYAGDEFVIVTRSTDVNYFDQKFDELKRELSIDVQIKSFSFQIPFSYGVQSNYDGELTFDEIFHQSDQKLYIHKASKSNK
jgi:diguanylate cyclase (GGDEF)-like protein